MIKVRAKVAHTLEPGSRYIHAGHELDIEDKQFDEAVHEEIDTDAEASKEPRSESAGVTLPAPKEPPATTGPAPASQQFSTPKPQDAPQPAPAPSPSATATTSPGVTVGPESGPDPLLPEGVP